MLTMSRNFQSKCFKTPCSNKTSNNHSSVWAANVKSCYEAFRHVLSNRMVRTTPNFLCTLFTPSVSPCSRQDILHQIIPGNSWIITVCCDACYRSVTCGNNRDYKSRRQALHWHICVTNPLLTMMMKEAEQWQQISDSMKKICQLPRFGSLIVFTQCLWLLICVPCLV